MNDLDSDILFLIELLKNDWSITFDLLSNDIFNLYKIQKFKCSISAAKHLFLNVLYIRFKLAILHQNFNKDYGYGE